MVCLICGSRTSPGSHLCGRCFKRVGDPLLMGTSALDPMADQRMLTHGSVLLMIGPSFMGETRSGKGLEPGLTFDRMIASEDLSHVPSYIDRYLNGLGIGVVLTGSEMLPRREIIPRMVRTAVSMDLGDERWARPCARLGNIVALALRSAISLPVEPSDSSQMASDLSSMAETLYGRALKDSTLERTVRANKALMRHWAGSSEEALASLKDLAERSAEEERPEMDIKRSQVLHDMGRDAEAIEVLKKLPKERMTERGRDLLNDLEAVQ
ncbi:MAG: hypothetical protein LLG16_03075 [Euryarchaeota archaeon]|nr:hypothetical protein [Euryarchaeota archaeon]